MNDRHNDVIEEQQKSQRHDTFPLDLDGIYTKICRIEINALAIAATRCALGAIDDDNRVGVNMYDSQTDENYAKNVFGCLGWRGVRALADCTNAHI